MIYQQGKAEYHAVSVTQSQEEDMNTQPAHAAVTEEPKHEPLMPTINAMSAIGLVTIPGMMTGQLLAGADVLQAAKYQMILMFMIAGASIMGVIGAVYAMAGRLTDNRHRLRLDRLQKRT